MKLDFSIPDAEERGVSPVIGVILMVAITVILAAVIGTFVLGLGDQVSQTAPQATISAESAGVVEKSTDDTTEEAFINLNHGGGDSLSSGETTVILNGGEVWSAGTGSQAVISGSAGTDNAIAATISSDPGELSTAGSWSIDVVATTGTAAAPDPADLTGDYTVTVVDEGSGQIVAEKNVEV